jgi:hypothetical protein
MCYLSASRQQAGREKWLRYRKEEAVNFAYPTLVALLLRVKQQNYDRKQVVSRFRVSRGRGYRV